MYGEALFKCHPAYLISPSHYFVFQMDFLIDLGLLFIHHALHNSTCSISDSIECLKFENKQYQQIVHVSLAFDNQVDIPILRLDCYALPTIEILFLSEVATFPE